MARGSLERPRRGEGRVIAGVCAALGRRFGVSTTLIRVLFVIAAFTGAGELVYLIAWLLFPKRR